MVWPVKTSKLLSPAEEHNRLRFVLPASQMTQAGMHTWRWCRCWPSAGHDGHDEHKRVTVLWDRGLPALHQAWRLGINRSGS